MEFSAFTKSSQVSPRKMRLVAEVVRKQNINDALETLAFLKKRGSDVLEKTLRSAMSNALNRNASRENLFIKRIDVSDGPAYKRFHPSTRGRVHPYKKRTSHVRIILSDEVNSKVKSQKSKEKVEGSEIKKEENGAKS